MLQSRHNITRKENIEAFIAQRIQTLLERQAQAEREKERQEQQREQPQIPQAKPAEKKTAKEPKPEPLPPHPVITSVTFGRIIDLNDPKIQASYGLTQWVKIQNLKNMSLSFNYLTEHHLLNMDDLRTTIDDLRSDYSRDTQVLVKTEKKLKTVNMLLKNLGIYHKFRPIHKQYIQSRKSPRFKEQHMQELLLYDGAVTKLLEFQKRTSTNSVPNMKDLQIWKKDFTAQQQELYDRRRRTKDTIQAMEDGYRLLKQLQPRQKSLNRQQYYQLE